MKFLMKQQKVSNLQCCIDQCKKIVMTKQFPSYETRLFFSPVQLDTECEGCLKFLQFLV